MSGDVLAHLSHARSKALAVLYYWDRRGAYPGRHELVRVSTHTDIDSATVSWQSAEWLRVAGLAERTYPESYVRITEKGRQLARRLAS